MQITGADLFVKALKEEQVRTLFAYPGGQAIDLFDALYKEQEMEADANLRWSGNDGIRIACWDRRQDRESPETGCGCDRRRRHADEHSGTGDSRSL